MQQQHPFSLRPSIHHQRRRRPPPDRTIPALDAGRRRLPVSPDRLLSWSQPIHQQWFGSQPRDPRSVRPHGDRRAARSARETRDGGQSLHTLREVCRAARTNPVKSSSPRSSGTNARTNFSLSPDTPSATSASSFACSGAQVVRIAASSAEQIGERYSTQFSLGTRGRPGSVCVGSHGGEQAEINWKRARLSVGCRRDCAQAARSQMPRHEGQVTQ